MIGVLIGLTVLIVVWRVVRAPKRGHKAAAPQLVQSIPAAPRRGPSHRYNGSGGSM
jgi:hypothetical protein